MMISPLCDALEDRLTGSARNWLEAAARAVAADTAAIHDLFPAVGRCCGRAPLHLDADEGRVLPPPGWSVADAARVVLLAAVRPEQAPLAHTLQEVYQAGAAPERRAVLLGLPVLEGVRPELGGGAVQLVADALRTHDPNLVGAAVGRYAARHLDAAGYRQAVLKCLFMGVPLAAVAGLDLRADGELARMLADFAHERVAAGRDVPDDVWPLLARFPEAVDASGLPAEAESTRPERRAAARRALARFTSACPTPADASHH
ncbi:EboA domain-containing protein [Streptomyces sp. NPDC004457]